MQKGNISVESPLARAPVNRRQGDQVTVKRSRGRA
jgi:transcription elongation GreA/GreB family factor